MQLPRRWRACWLNGVRHVGRDDPLFEGAQSAVARPRVAAQLDAVQAGQALHGLLTQLFDAGNEITQKL